jgi:methylated-DNA-[protein]-cysteine S-methyltransferase
MARLPVTAGAWNASGAWSRKKRRRSPEHAAEEKPSSQEWIKSQPECFGFKPDSWHGSFCQSRYHYIECMMTELGFAIFETAIGRCGIVWSGRGIVGVQLPEASERATRNRVLRRFARAREAAPPADVQRAIEEIVALISGEPRDLRDLRIDEDDVPNLHRRVYDVTRTIPPGRTLTYGEIAERLGDRTLARDVGVALSQNRWPIIVPCHRVLAAGGKVGGFSARGGIDTKMRLLSIEGAQPAGPMLFDDLPIASRRPSPRRRRA